MRPPSAGRCPAPSSRRPRDIEAPECRPERVPLAEHDRPAQPDLEHAQCERLEHRGLVVGARAPGLVVVADEGGIAGAGPGAAWLSVQPDDHIAAHPTACAQPFLDMELWAFLRPRSTGETCDFRIGVRMPLD